MEKAEKKILIVDDDLRMDKMLFFLFEGRGFQAKFADSGRYAMKLLEHFKPDVIILDLMMPDMDGFEVFESINKNSTLKNIPVIVLSALPSSKHKERAISLGACAYIDKPFVSEQLIDKIWEVIG